VQSESRVSILNVPYVSAYIVKVMRRRDGSHTPQKKAARKPRFAGARNGDQPIGEIASARRCYAVGETTREGFVTPGSACWIWVGAVAEGHEENQLRRISVPALGHTSGDLALSPVHTQLS
jgi:hypothetical protein